MSHDPYQGWLQHYHKHIQRPLVGSRIHLDQPLTTTSTDISDMGIHEKVIDDLTEVDVIIAGGMSDCFVKECRRLIKICVQVELLLASSRVA